MNYALSLLLCAAGLFGTYLLHTNGVVPPEGTLLLIIAVQFFATLPMVFMGDDK
jgi:hypothetical protein